MKQKPISVALAAGAWIAAGVGVWLLLRPGSSAPPVPNFSTPVSHNV